MIVIAFDASINTTGYAVVDIDNKNLPESLKASGTFKVKKDATLVEKIVILAGEVDELCKFYPPEVVIIEKAEGYAYADRQNFGGKAKNAGSMALNNIAVGVIAASASNHCMNIKFVSAQEWKGMQAKRVTRLVVNNEYKLALKRVNNDEVDAIAIASWFRREQKLKKRMMK